MKTRILGLLLLVAMLLTAIPVVAAAEEAAVAPITESASEATPELYTLYTDRGLVALYTAFSNDGSVDLENGTWANKVAGGAPAILRDESKSGNYWTVYKMGIGYSMTHDQFKTKNTTYPNALGDGRNVGITLSDDYNTENFTVDAFAKVAGITNEDGSAFVAPSEGALYNANVSAFRFDVAGCFFFAGLRGGTVSGEKVYDYYKRPASLQPNSWAWGYSSSLANRWYVQNVGFENKTPPSPGKYFDTQYQENGWLMARGHHDDASTDQTIPVAAVMHLEKVTTPGADRASTTITYTVSYNNNQKLAYYGATATIATITGETYDGIKAVERKPTLEYAEGDISLFNGVPGEIYAIRVYADALTAEEKAINRMVDLLYYYGVKVPSLFFEEKSALSSVAYVANDITIVADEAKTAATKALLQDTLDSTVANRTALDGYAATDALVAFFTTSVKTSIDQTAGTWTDIIGGSVATLEGKDNWTFRDNGAFGFDAWSGYMKGGSYTKGKSGFTGPQTGYVMNKYRLLFDINILPDEDFTVEYLATYRPLLIADADKSTANKVAYYEVDGTPLSAYDYATSLGITAASNAVVAQCAEGWAGDMLGFFGNHTQWIDGPGGWGAAPRGTVYWTVALARFGSPTNQQFLGGGWATVDTGAKNGLAKKAEAYHVVGGTTFNTYGISVDETVVGANTQALFTIYRDAAKYADNSAKVNSTANNAAADVAKHTDTYYYYKGDDGRIYYKSGSTYYDDITGEAKPDSVTVGSQTAEEWGTAYYDFDYTEMPSVWGNQRHGFWLSAGVPTDFLNIRIYNRVLTQAEKNQNRLADIKAYYGLELDDKYMADEALVNQILYQLATFTDAGLLTDASKKQAGKAAMEAVIVPFITATERDRAYDYSSLYVTESETGAKLVGLFSAIDGNFTADVTTGVWKNLVAGGADATIRDTGTVKYWEKRDMGIGYTFHYKVAVYRGSMGTTPGVNDYISENSDYDEVGIRLPDEYENLESFTVESFATMVGATDDTGARWAHTGQLYTTISNFRFGLLGTCGFQGLMHTLDSTTGAVVDRYYKTNDEYAFKGYSGSTLALRWLTHNAATAYVAGMYTDDLGPVRVGDAENDHRYAVASVLQVEKLTTNVMNAEGTAIDKDASTVFYKISYNNETSQMNSWGDYKNRTLTRTVTEYEELLKTASGTINAKTGRFSMFNDWASDVYVIRVYDGALTAAEKSQNRLADLMYYHGVALPEGLADNATALAAIAPVADTIVISPDSAKMLANKLTIEAALNANLSTVTITDGAETLLTENVAGATYKLPATIDGKAAVVYTVNGEAILPGTEIDASADIIAEVVRVDAPKTQAKAGLRLAEDTADMGIRFLADIDTADFEAIKAAYGLNAITVGMLITPVKYVELANGVFTREALNAMVASYSSSSKAAYVEVIANGFYTSDENTCTIAGSLYKFSATTMAKDPAFTAVAFIDIRVGEDVYTIYGNYDANVAAQVTEVAVYARPFATSEQKGWIDNLLSQFGA